MLLEPERIDKWAKGTSQAWYPHARIYQNHMISRGKYAKPPGVSNWVSGPVGIVNHWTQGHSDGLGSDAIAYGTKMGHGYLVNDYAGQLHQASPFTDWSYHAGVSYWPQLGHGVSQYLIGVENICAGKLVEKNGLFYPDWPSSKPIPTDRTRTGEHRDNCIAGTYEIFSQAQLDTLFNFALWCKDNFPSFSFDFVLAHDEISPGRKVDTGWSMPCTMPEFRQMLKDKYAESHRAEA